MKNPWQVRFDTSLETVRKYILATGKRVGAEDIRKIEDQVFGTTDLTPSTDDYKVYPFEGGFDFERFLSYLYAIKNDSDYINNMLSYLEVISKNIDISIQLEEVSLHATEKIGNKYIALLSASTFIEGITREIKIPEEIDIASLGLSLAGDFMSLLPLEQGLQQPAAYTNDDVVFKIIEQTTMQGFNVNGNRASVLSNSFRRGISVSVYTTNIERVGIEFRLRTRWSGVTSIKLDLKPGFVGTEIEVYRLEAIGKELELLEKTLINQETMEITTSGDVRELVIRMFKNYPDVTIPERKEYQFVLEKVTPKSNSTTREGSATSVAIEVPEGTGYVALIAEDYVPADGQIIYQIATLSKENDPTEQIVWFNIKPNNQQPAISLVDNELPADRFISLSKGKLNYTITRTGKWALTVKSGYRVPLYNILEGLTATLGNEFKIEGGKLTPVNNTISIEEDGITLYNGQGDWAVLKEKPVSTTAVDNVFLECKINPSTGWFEPFALAEPIEIVVKPSSDTNTFNSEFEPIYYENIRMFDEDDKEIAVVVNQVNEVNNNPDPNTWDIVLSETMSANVAYRIKYTIKIRTQTTIDTNTLKLTNGGNTLVAGVDYLYSPVNHLIILKRTNVPKSEALPVVAAFTRTVTDEQEIQYYQTWLTLTKRVTIPIGTFTQIEFSRGNFHRINGVDVSLENEILLNPGLHKIESTQPYPSATGINGSQDYNFYTKEYSDAYIDLTGLDFRAFDKPMRRVSVTDMEYNIPENSRATYVFDNNMILLNTKPSWTEPALLATAAGAGAIGDYLLGRTFDKESQTNISNPESYYLIVNFKTDSGKRYVKVKVIMERTGIISPRVKRLGILPVPVS